MGLHQRFTLIALVALALAVLFMFVGLPYDHFSWAKAITDYGTTDTPVVETPPLDPIGAADPDTAPPVFIVESESLEAALPEDGVLFAPEVAKANIGVSADLVNSAVIAYDFVLFVNGRSSAEPFNSPITVCLKDPAAGLDWGLIFLAADQAPRVPVNLAWHRGWSAGVPYVCTAIDRPGTLVLVYN